MNYDTLTAIYFAVCAVGLWALRAWWRAGTKRRDTK